jgi:hypothetical protein
MDVLCSSWSQKGLKNVLKCANAAGTRSYAGSYEKENWPGTFKGISHLAIHYKALRLSQK